MTDSVPKRALVPCPHCTRANRIDLGRVDDRPRCGECGRPILLDRPIQVSDADFDRVIGGSDVPVMVDFYADWCGPCKVMAPVLDDFADERRGRILVTKLDTDRNPATAGRFEIRGIPTLIVFVDGAEVARETGAVGKRRLESLATEAGVKGAA
ncbi:MAG TPA: thioredoxin [Gemmatimonadota bacterium]|nr:thioredoxin [Gemmatimonadota bacterium]